MSDQSPPAPDPVPGTPAIDEMRSELLVSECDTLGGFCPDHNGGGTRKFGLRAEIDTSPPFGSVKEAVDRFGGSGPWVPCYRIGDDFGEIDIKKVEEQAAELEKDLIVKELETLDVLEELGTTKKIVEDLKHQLQKEALRCMMSPAAAIKRVNKENSDGFHQRLMMMTMGSSPSPSSSPEMILMELKQAKLNLGKTINDLGNTRKRLTSKFAGVLSLEEELKQARRKPEQLKTITEVSKPVNGQSTDLRTAELRLVAARKMEEAARAAEAVALAEIKSLSNTNPPEPDLFKPVSKPQKTVSKVTKYEPSNSKMQILKKMREATEEVRRSKQALEDALNKVEMAGRKQFDAEEAFLKWIPEDDHDGLGQAAAAYYNSRLSNMDHEPKPVLRPTVSMRDFLGRKQQVVTEDYAAARPVEAAASGRNGRQKVALSQMLHDIRDDLSFHPRPPPKQEGGGDQKQQFFTQRRKFGFIHISLPMSKMSKKKDARFD
ncbi:WEB family protein At2g40480 [Linum grandiflorum]